MYHENFINEVTFSLGAQGPFLLPGAFQSTYSGTMSYSSLSPSQDVDTNTRVAAAFLSRDQITRQYFLDMNKRTPY